MAGEKKFQSLKMLSLLWFVAMIMQYVRHPSDWDVNWRPPVQFKEPYNIFMIILQNRLLTRCDIISTAIGMTSSTYVQTSRCIVPVRSSFSVSRITFSNSRITVFTWGFMKFLAGRDITALYIGILYKNSFIGMNYLFISCLQFLALSRMFCLWPTQPF